MKNKHLLILSVLMALTIMIGQFVLAARPGVFGDANFIAPDYNSGASDAFNVGEAKTLNYNCYCAYQKNSAGCSGSIILQADSGSGFVNIKTDSCNVGLQQSCYASYSNTFSTPGVYAYRVFCDESAGTDYTMPSNDYVTLTMLEGCTNGQTRLCPLQHGVCEGSHETCNSGSWSGCNYASIPSYEADEATCDGFDNDCNGLVDDVDADGDGFGACVGSGLADNELLIGALNNYAGFEVFGFNPTTSQYDSLWSYMDNASNQDCGGEAGDVNHDGIVDFVVTRQIDGQTRLEVWTYGFGTLYRLWRAPLSGHPSLALGGVGDIGDFDNDGLNEILVTSGNTGVMGAYIYETDTIGGTSFSYTILFTDDNCRFLSAAGDMDNDGTPELITQCADEDIKVWEWNGNSYENIASLTKPPRVGDGQIVDDMECGDIDGTPGDECVICGNFYTSHVIDYDEGAGAYYYAYSAPLTSPEALTQTCSVGDVTNDGKEDWFDVSENGVRVFTYQNGQYMQLWTGSEPFNGLNAPRIGCSAIGDFDNDGYIEFITDLNSDLNTAQLWESDIGGATSFTDTKKWTSYFGGSIISGNLDTSGVSIDCNDNNNAVYPGAVEICGNGIDEDCDGSDLACPDCIDNDGDGYGAYCALGADCNDNDYFVNPGAAEACGDGIDNNCNGEVDEGCVVVPFCGDGYCDGLAYSENCNTCSADCWAGSRGACCGDGKCDSRKGETAAVCPVDC